MSTLSTTASSLISTLTGSGMSLSSAISSAKTLLGFSAAKNSLSAMAAQLLLNEGNPANVAKIGTDMAPTPGCPQVIVSLTTNLSAPGITQQQFMDVYEDIENEIARM